MVTAENFYNMGSKICRQPDFGKGNHKQPKVMAHG